MLKQIILVVALCAAGTSAYLVFKAKPSVPVAPTDGSVLEIPVTTTQVAPGQGAVE